MSVITDERDLIVTALQDAGLNAFGYLPERVSAPLTVVSPADPYLIADEETPFRSWTLNLSVFVIVGKSVNVSGAQEMDTTVETVLQSLGPDARQVSMPTQIELNGYSYLGAVIDIERLVTVKGNP